MNDCANDLLAMGRNARTAAIALRSAPVAQRNHALTAAAQAVRHRSAEILAANKIDMSFAKDEPSAFRDRLLLNEDRIESAAASLEKIADLPDPLGHEIARWQRPNGLDIQRISTPIGVIGMIFESRPNVTVDASAMCIKSGNAVILRAGSASQKSCQTLLTAIHEGLLAAGMSVDVVQLVATTDREAVGSLLSGLNGSIDLIIPRGGRDLVARVQKEARVPVLAHLEGICHVYLHESASPQMALKIALNAKMRRTGICGAAETLLVDRAILHSVGLPAISKLHAAGCEIRGDAEVCAAFAKACPATEADWRSEYLDAIISVKTVANVDEAIGHIETYGSHHTECIVAEDHRAAEQFLSSIDSAIVLWNASTQFADGGEFGMGGEIGIGTGKLHARGPVGVEQLTTFKYVVRGNGQLRV